MSDIIIYPTDDKLREYTLTDDDLAFAENIYAGWIRVLSTGRYHARISVGKEVRNFTVGEVGPDERDLQSDEPADIPPMLSSLTWHRAAEAILAHRSGHEEARRNIAFRKAQKRERQEAY